jgi:hypothetical protein
LRRFVLELSAFSAWTDAVARPGHPDVTLPMIGNYVKRT